MSLLFALLLAGILDLSTPEQSVWNALQYSNQDRPANAPVESKAEIEDPASDEIESQADVDWAEALRPQGTSTSLGAAIQFVINKERGGPLAGVLVISDGQSNSGLPLPTAVAAAENASVSVFPVGVGSIEVLKNIEIADIQAPPRVLPKDDFKLAVILKSFGFANRQVRVTLTSVAEDEALPEGETSTMDIEDEQVVDLVEDGSPVPLEFDLRAEKQGKRRYQVKVEALEGDSNLKDNLAEVVVDAIQRETKIMLIAGGPSREFRFLRNQLYRDKNFTSDVWLQSASKGADQEAANLLEEFPKTAAELSDYDCIIAFDPDWRDLSDEQTEMLERWVAEEAGGLILVAGPVNTPEWTRRPRGDEAIDRIRDLYPVAFFNQGSARLKLGRFGGDTAYPLAFTREGKASRFLWLGDSASASTVTWGKFEGVFGYYAVNEPKAGADILANFSDQSTAVNEDLPIYLASHFYGAGRVFFQASGEMWRVRRIDVDYFQNYYDQLIRWASQGRLIRDSQRGVLLTDRDRCWVGDQIRVQAILKNDQNDPLMSESVIASLVLPDGQTQSIELRSAGAAIRPGTFDGICVVDQEGEYQVVLPIPGSATNDVLVKTFQASIPDLEKLKPQRNDPALQDLADRTGGHYFVGMKSLESIEDDAQSLSTLIVPQDQETFLTGTLNRIFQQKLMIWLLTWFVFAMCVEWTIRRCHKLS
ncbi:VWA domain-containing protein [Mariniblastus sp.]|nr:VWA domain-containing protein [Mariniblastus sp.]